MRLRRTQRWCATVAFGGAWLAVACSGGEGYPGGNTGGAPASHTGGSTGMPTGGSSGTTGGANGAASGGAATAVPYSRVVAFIDSQCAPCHDGAEMPNLHPADPAGLYTLLTTRVVTQCGGNKMVTPFDPSKSALLMVGTDKCSGLKMPSGCGEPLCFAANDIAMLTEWITSGAKNQ